MKGVVADGKKEVEDALAAGDRDAAACRKQSLRDNRPGRRSRGPPEVAVARLEPARGVRDDEPAAAFEIRIGLMAETSEHDEIGQIELALEIAPIGLVA